MICAMRYARVCDLSVRRPRTADRRRRGAVRCMMPKPSHSPLNAQSSHFRLDRRIAAVDARRCRHPSRCRCPGRCSRWGTSARSRRSTRRTRSRRTRCCCPGWCRHRCPGCRRYCCPRCRSPPCRSRSRWPRRCRRRRPRRRCRDGRVGAELALSLPNAAAPIAANTTATTNPRIDVSLIAGDCIHARLSINHKSEAGLETRPIAVIRPLLRTHDVQAFAQSPP